MARLGVNINQKPQTRRYNLWRGILEVCLKRECDVADVRYELAEAIGNTDSWLSKVIRAGIDNEIDISLVAARAAEAYFKKELGYEWRLEIRPKVSTQLLAAV